MNHCASSLGDFDHLTTAGSDSAGDFDQCMRSSPGTAEVHLEQCEVPKAWKRQGCPTCFLHHVLLSLVSIPFSRLYTDMRDREYDGLEHTLLYAAGFPCQPLPGC